MKELKEYLHYYIGVNVITTYDNEQAELEGVSDDNAHIVHAGTGSYGTCDVSGVKPILRRLEDMTEEEALKLATIYSGADKIKRTTGTVNNFFYFFCEFRFGDRGVSELLIMHKGEAWYQSYFYKKPTPGKGHNIINQFEGAHYLLKQQFDLFGLIDAGLAVDAKTIISNA